MVLLVSLLMGLPEYCRADLINDLSESQRQVLLSEKQVIFASSPKTIKAYRIVESTPEEDCCYVYQFQ
jgi:hypothetical protein